MKASFRMLMLLQSLFIRLIRTEKISSVSVNTDRAAVPEQQRR